jgi:hypothetical protein
MWARSSTSRFPRLTLPPVERKLHNSVPRETVRSYENVPFHCPLVPTVHCSVLEELVKRNPFGWHILVMRWSALDSLVKAFTGGVTCEDLFRSRGSRYVFWYRMTRIT